MSNPNCSIDARFFEPDPSAKYESIKDIYIGVFFDGTANNMVRTATERQNNLNTEINIDNSELRILEINSSLNPNKNAEILNDIQKLQDKLEKNREEVENLAKELKAVKENIRNHIRPNPSTGYTNIAILYSLFNDNKIIDSNKNKNALAYHIYVEGSGATDIKEFRGSNLDGLGFGVGHTGVVGLVSKAVKAVNDFLSSLSSIKKTEVTLHFLVFGFSRGATCARLFTHLVTRGQGKNGIIKREREFKKFEAKKLYDKYDKNTFKLKFLDDFNDNKRLVEFLGIYDTVTSIGVIKYKDGSAHDLNLLVKAIWRLELSQLYDNWHCNNVNEYGLYSHDKAKQTFHICAIDEYRENFAITDLGKSVPDHCLEVFVPGCHSDVGGSYYTGDEEVEIVLKNKTKTRNIVGFETIHKGTEAEYDKPVYGEIQHMIQAFKPDKKQGDDIKPLSIETLMEMGWLDKNWGTKDAQTIKINSKKVPCTIRAEDMGDSICFKRNVLGGYSNITLKMMWNKSENLKCFDNIPDYYSIPVDLKSISESMELLINGTGRKWFFPDDDTYKELRLKYLHFSSSNSIVNIHLIKGERGDGRKKLRMIEGKLANISAEPNFDDNKLMCRIVYHGDDTRSPQEKGETQIKSNTSEFKAPHIYSVTTIMALLKRLLSQQQEEKVNYMYEYGSQNNQD